MKLKYFFAVTILALITSVGFAGLSQPASVEIDLDLRTAQGDQVTARTADNDTEFIGCGSRICSEHRPGNGEDRSRHGPAY